METKNFQDALLEWYQINHRQLPFRESHDPYNIWISEIMLQQTQMDTVLPYYERFMTTFPTVLDLAKAEEDSVLKLWEGLGYYSRARNLLKCARVIVSEHDGNFPEDYKAALKLPGIGPYTAGAILSIAFNQKVPAVDGNVMRVFSRLFNMQLDISIPKNKRIFEEKVTEHMPENAGDFNQALMELGALICLPKNPVCDICPIKEACIARSLSIQSQLPVKKTKIRKDKVHIAVGIVRRGEVILITKTNTALLKGMWGFPVAEGKDKSEAGENLLSTMSKSFLIGNNKLIEIGVAKHVFTHKTWLMTLYEIQGAVVLEEENMTFSYGVSIEAVRTAWVTLDEIEKYAMATAFKKLLKQLSGSAQKRLQF